MLCYVMLCHILLNSVIFCDVHRLIFILCIVIHSNCLIFYHATRHFNLFCLFNLFIYLLYRQYLNLVEHSECDDVYVKPRLSSIYISININMNMINSESQSTEILRSIYEEWYENKK